MYAKDDVCKISCTGCIIAAYAKMKYVKGTVFYALYTFWRLLDRMETKPKSGNLLTKSCGPALDPKLPLFFGVAPYFTSRNIF